MKVIKAEEVLEPQVKNETNPNVDKKLVAKLTEKFEAIRIELETKQYGIALNKEQSTFLLNEFFVNVSWKGYEAYAIAETHKALNGILGKNGEVNGNINVEIIEAIFHFLKNYESKGYQFAQTFKEACDQFAVPMQEINQDRQNLRDASLEMTAAEQGISVDSLVEQFNAQQGPSQGQPQY
jgi:hypothetical protein